MRPDAPGVRPAAPRTGPAAAAVPPPGGANGRETDAVPDAAASRPAVSVVVCAYTTDRWADLWRAIDSLRKQAEQPAEIILVVDHSPALLQDARQHLAGITIVPNRFGRGLSGARNTGVAVARGDVVAFLDDDAVADPGWTARLAAGYAGPRVLGVGGQVRPLWDAGRPGWFPPELDWVVGCSYRGMPVHGGQVRNFIGANMSFRREVLTAAGGFSAALGRVGTVPLGCEETELCLRISQRDPGGALAYEPAARVGHRVREDRATWKYLRSRCYSEGLSKARVAELAGRRRALSAERSYLWSAASRGVCRSLGEAARGRPAGLASAAALVTAVIWAGAGYLAGRIADARPALAGRTGVARAAPWAGLAASLVLWVYALGNTDAARVTTSGLGLVSVLPVAFWAALGVLTVSFGLAVSRQPGRWPLTGACLAVLVAMLHATPAIVYGTLRYSWTWKHIGVTDYIAHHGVDFSLGGALGVYQGWPGFFALNAFLSGSAGLTSALSYASWALPAFDLLWLGPVVLIARAFTSSQRLAWTAAWLFELGNWVGQDYFSPQAFAYFLYLAVIAVCLRWLWDPGTTPGLVQRAAGRAGRRLGGAVAGLRRPGRAAPAPAADGPAGRPAPPAGVRYALIACLVPLMVAIASSHQLTPFMVTEALALLSVSGQLKPRVLPVMLAVATTAGWLAYGALPWLAANSYQIFAGMGVPWANTSAHLVGGGPVPAGQFLVNWGARLLSAAIGVLAIAGFFRYRRHHGKADRRSWRRIALLALAALPAAAANSYGGEIIFRVYLFALPFLAVAAAAAFFPHPAAPAAGGTAGAARFPDPAAAAGRPGRHAWLSGLALVATSLLLAAGFSLGNYGKDAMNYFTPAEVAAAQWLYRTAPRGAAVVAADSNFPWAFTHYNEYSYTFLDDPAALGKAVQRDPVTTVTAIMRPGRVPRSYLIFTPSQAAEISLTGQWPPGTYSRILHDLLASGAFRVVYRNSGAIILEVV